MKQESKEFLSPEAASAQTNSGGRKLCWALGRARGFGALTWRSAVIVFQDLEVDSG